MSIVIDKQVKLKEGSFHIHDSYEIVIIESGNAILKGLDLNYNLSKGDAIIIPPNFKHVFVPKNGELAYYYVFGISDAYLNSNEPIVIKGDLIADATTLINLIYSNRATTNEEYFIGLVNSLILLLSSNIKTLTDINLSVNSIIKKIHRDFANVNLNVTTLLSTSGYAEDYIRAYFKKITGKTPNEFITLLRITHAKKLINALKNTVSLTYIAQSCGYDDYCYFSRKFKEVTGLSPKQYKKIQG